MFENLLLKEHNDSEIGLRVVNLFFIGLIFMLTRVIHTHKFVAWIFVGVFTYLLAVEQVDEMSENNILSRSLSHYFTIMILTVFTAVSGIRFLHSLIMGVLMIISGFVEVGIMGMVDIEVIY